MIRMESSRVSRCRRPSKRKNVECDAPCQAYFGTSYCHASEIRAAASRHSRRQYHTSWAGGLKHFVTLSLSESPQILRTLWIWHHPIFSIWASEALSEGKFLSFERGTPSRNSHNCAGLSLTILKDMFRNWMDRLA
jgi:hypothetical protein